MPNEMFSQSSYEVLKFLNQNEIKSKVKAVSVQFMTENLSYSKVTINKVVKELISKNLISYGLKGRANTYYINSIGIEKLKEFEEE